MSTALTSAPNGIRRADSGHDLSKAHRKRILIVDDDAGVLFSLSRLFDILEVDVDTCIDPEEAMRLLAERSYDLVISDERMPKMSGMELLGRIRAASPRTPTILMTAYGDPKQFTRAYESCGVFHYLTKPWDNFDLIVTVREALRAGEAIH